MQLRHREVIDLPQATKVVTGRAVFSRGSRAAESELYNYTLGSECRQTWV